MQTTCVSNKDNANSNDSEHSFVIRENTRLKHRCYFVDYFHQVRRFFDACFGKLLFFYFLLLFVDAIDENPFDVRIAFRFRRHDVLENV